MIAPIARQNCAPNCAAAAHEIWKRFCFSHFLKTDPLSSTKLFETSSVSSTLLFELTATLSATDWMSRMSVCTEMYTKAMAKSTATAATTARFRVADGVLRAVANSASRMSWRWWRWR